MRCGVSIPLSIRRFSTSADSSAFPCSPSTCRRDLATDLGKSGWENIPIDEREGITPAAPATSAHRQYLFAVTGGKRPDRAGQSAEATEFDRFVRAQQT